MSMSMAGLALPLRHRMRIIDSNTARGVAEKPMVVRGGPKLKEKFDARQFFRVLDGSAFSAAVFPLYMTEITRVV